MFIRLGHELFKYRDFLFPAVFLIIILGTESNPFLGSVYADRYLSLAGFLAAFSGQFLRAAVIGFAYIRRGGKNKTIYADKLVQEGFFAVSRNPLYLGNILILIGLGIIANSIWFYILGIPFFLVAYLSITMAEEDYLMKRFGKEYEDYCKRVNRFIPNFKGIKPAVCGMTFSWKRLVSKEYGTTFTWIATAIAIMIWKGYSYKGFFLLYIPLVFAYSAARYMKKTGRLQE